MYTITANSIPSLQRIGSVKLSRMEKTLECSMFDVHNHNQFIFRLDYFLFRLSQFPQFIRRRFRFRLDLFIQILYIRLESKEAHFDQLDCKGCIKNRRYAIQSKYIYVKRKSQKFSHIDRIIVG